MNSAVIKEDMPTAEPLHTDIFFTAHGRAERAPHIVWAHGWGQSHHSLLTLSRSFETQSYNLLVDLPGFGQSSVPPHAWSTREYADALADLIRSQARPPVIWVGHSFGGRVGIQLAAHYPDLVSGLVLIASAGLKPKRPVHQTLYIKGRVALYKALKKLVPLGVIDQERLLGWFGSADYKTAGPMRQILVKTINEDLSREARQIRCPALLVYGDQDRETRPEIGRRLEMLIPEAKMVLLAGQDHYSVLGEGRHQVAPLIKEFVTGPKNV